METSYVIYDRRDGREIRVGIADSEMDAIRESGIEPRFAEVEAREVPDDAARECVGFPRLY